MRFSVAADAPASPEDLFKAGASAFQAGDYASAAKSFEAVLGEGPTGEALETILFTLASTYFNQKNLPKAEEYYNRCLKEFPDGKNKTKALIAFIPDPDSDRSQGRSRANTQEGFGGNGCFAAKG
jgi:TolA-binding protein